MISGEAEAGVIAIDGPAGAGKSTVARMLARRLRYLYLDSGAMYRAVAVRAEREGVDPEDEAALEKLCRDLRICFRLVGDTQQVICQGEDVTPAIRRPEVGWLASKVSLKRPVREAMARLQREIGRRGGVVAEGRDMGTVVFPQARFKFFLTASPEERARRRFADLRDRGYEVPLEKVAAETRARDEQDSTRELAPLRPAEDARPIDSTGLTPEEVVEKMVAAMESAF
ncbi:MAG: (d)CMP kinase [Deltaproteobacteria bacterium]|nr:(d)CMP kinase [Deltaproteobacteria bacterium]